MWCLHCGGRVAREGVRLNEEGYFWGSCAWAIAAGAIFGAFGWLFGTCFSPSPQQHHPVKKLIFSRPIICKYQPNTIRATSIHPVKTQVESTKHATLIVTAKLLSGFPSKLPISKSWTLHKLTDMAALLSRIISMPFSQ
jgi:hypothetical protein